MWGIYDMSKKPVKETIHAKGIEISIYSEDFKNEFISLTDIARYKSDEPFIVINNWMRGKDTIDFLGLWEQLQNPNFKPIEFDRFRKEAGYNAFTLSPKNGLIIQMQLELYQNQGDMAEPLLTQILHLNLHRGFQQNLNSTSSKTTRD